MIGRVLLAYALAVALTAAGVWAAIDRGALNWGAPSPVSEIRYGPNK